MIADDSVNSSGNNFSSPSGSDTEVQPHDTSCHLKYKSIVNNATTKRYSMDSAANSNPNKMTTVNSSLGSNNFKENSDLHSLDEFETKGVKTRLKKSAKKLEAELQHRRSLSENIITFPLHTKPSDKARCHQMQRQNSVIPPSPESPITSNLTLRKVAETMCLKDPQYKPIRTDQNGVKSNPFTALAQLRGVKKILGANPRTYTAGVGDLFSSCFEMTEPFFKEIANSMQKATKNSLEPKSLPTSPNLTRKFSAHELKLSPTTRNKLESLCDNHEGW